MPQQNGSALITYNKSAKNYIYKPKDIAKIVYRQHISTISELIDCAKEGFAFCYLFSHNGDFLNQKEKNILNFASTQIILLDFDHMVLSPDVLCKSLTFKPSAYYTTYSNLKDGRYSYRFIYVLDCPVYGVKQWEAVRDAIADKCGFCSWKDENGKDCGYDKRPVSQQYFGTTQYAQTGITNIVYSASDFGVDLDSIPVSNYTTDITSNKSHNDENKVITRTLKKVDDTFLTDYLSLSTGAFIAKYQAFEVVYRNSLKGKMTMHNSGAMYLYSEDYAEVPRKWRNNRIERYQIGEDRKKKIYLTSRILLHNSPEMTIEQMIYCLASEVMRYYDNSDNKLNKQYILEVAQNAYRYTTPLKYENKHKFQLCKDFWIEKGVSLHAAISYCQKLVNYDAIAEYYDPSISISKNVEIMRENGVKTSRRSLQRYLKDGGCVTIPQGDTADNMVQSAYNDTWDSISFHPFDTDYTDMQVADSEIYTNNEDIAQIADNAFEASFITPLSGAYVDVTGNGDTSANANKKEKEGYILSALAHPCEDVTISNVTNDTIPATSEDEKKESSDIIRDMLIYLNDNADVTINDLADAFSVTTRTAKRYMKKLQINNYITRIGNNRKGYWKVTDEGEKLIEKH